MYLCFAHLFSQGMLFRCCQYYLFHINTAESSEINWCLQLPLPLLSSLAWVDSFRAEKTCHINLSIRPVQLWDLFSLSILLKKWVICPQRFYNWGTGKKPFKNKDKIHKGAQLAIFGIIIHKFYLGHKNLHTKLGNWSFSSFSVVWSIVLELLLWKRKTVWYECTPGKWC